MISCMRRKIERRRETKRGCRLVKVDIDSLFSDVPFCQYDNNIIPNGQPFT